jgi:hypothetical protein
MSVTAVWRRSFCLTGKFGPVIFFPFLNVFWKNDVNAKWKCHLQPLKSTRKRL